MNYYKFVRCATEEDDFNIFLFCEDKDVSGLPESLTSFYGKYNPIDVDVTFPEIGTVKFYPVEELQDLQKDYLLPHGCFVFATCNGDPIFVSDGKVMTTLPKVYRPKVLATDFDEFLNIYISSRYWWLLT